MPDGSQGTRHRTGLAGRMDGSVLHDDSAAVLVVHRRSGPAAPRPNLQTSEAPPAGPDELWLDRTRVSEVIPNTPPDGQVGVIPGTVGPGWRRRRSCGAAPQSRCVVRRSPTGSGWSRSVQMLLVLRASRGTSALVQGKVAVGVRKLSWETVAARWNLLRVVGPCISGLCVDGIGTPRHDVTLSPTPFSAPFRGGHWRFSAVHRSSAMSLLRFLLNSIE